MKSLVNYLVLTFDEIANTTNSVVINSGNGINYGFISVILLAISCLLLLVPILIKYYIKRGSIITCLLSY